MVRWAPRPRCPSIKYAHRRCDFSSHEYCPAFGVLHHNPRLSGLLQRGLSARFASDLFVLTYRQSVHTPPLIHIHAGSMEAFDGIGFRPTSAGWEPAELRDRLFFDLVHPDELQRVKELHSDVILADKAATIAYVRLKHKDAHKGYIVCALVRPTWCPLHPRHLIRCPGSDGGHRPVDRKVCARTSLSVLDDLPYSSVSFAHPGGEALHINSTAQEVVVISTAASNFEFQRWHESSPHRSSSPITALTPPPELPMSQSPRTAFLLDRFSTNCTITRYTNHQLVDAGSATTRPFFDFVAPDDEMVVRSWLCVVKRCGVNDHGQPSSGGFSYGRFLFFPRGRQSLAICRSVANAAQPLLCEWRRMTIRPLENGEFLVDAIFSAHSDGLVCILRRATG
ncbi:unnamed protein product [Mycena citricolor]|uniref:PAS domain-containing protein n=1 Tax=Mycena citricolor TaxID=2018698 RepID=A0AAD2JZJ9_9AGAR|nr:unnamed protein product [Mycena citricolor]